MSKFLNKNNFSKENQMVSSKPGHLYYLLSIILMVSIFNLFSCSESSKYKISEGQIDYDIEFLDNKDENPIILSLPREMTTIFKNNSTYTLIEGFLSTFKLVYITNNSTQKNCTLFQMMDKKFYHQSEANQLAFGYQNMENVKIIHTNIEKEISGFKCKKAIAHFVSGEHEDIEVYYTREIKVKEPNRNNPFHEIDGVLMEFTVNLLGINMKIRAKNVTKKKINSEIFEIPEGFKSVNPKELEEIINRYNPKGNE
jgi:GLPGLI family protein